MKKIKIALALSVLCSSAQVIAQENKYELGLDAGLYSLYTNHGSENQAQNYYGDASNSGTKLNMGFNFTNHLDRESAIRFQVNMLSTSPREGVYTINSVDYPFEKKFESNHFDLDFINKFQFGSSTIGLLAGLRYAKTEWNSRAGYYGEGGLFNSPNKFSGFGPSVGLTFKRPLNDKFSAVAEIKYSHLFGSVSAPANSNLSSRKSATSSIFDTQLGIQYTQKLQGNKSLVYGLTYNYVNFMRLSNLVQHIDPEDTDYTVAGPKLSVKYLFD